MDIFVARQPIFDKEKKVFAYELLYRSSLENRYIGNSMDQATSSVIINSFSLIGLNKLTGSKKALIKFTPRLIAEEVATILPNDLAIISVKGDISGDLNALEACRKLKNNGYTLVMEKFSLHDKENPLASLVDFIKVDFLEIPKADRREIAKWVNSRGKGLIGEKIETIEEYKEALEQGYGYFQGNFFSKPMVVGAKDIKRLSINSLCLLEEVNKEPINYHLLEKYIRMDVSLTYKLLKFINAAYFGFHTEISSVKQALVFLGNKEIRKWIYLVVLQEVCNDKPDELLVLALIRARFCEGMAPILGLENRKDDLFFLGLFSLIDAFLDQPMVSVLVDLPIKEEIKAALLGQDNPLRKAYNTMQLYEKGKFETFNDLADREGIPKSQIAELYVNSLEFAHEFNN